MNERDDERLTDYLAGRLSEQQARELAARIASDPEWARRKDFLLAARAALRRSTRPAPPDLKAALRRLARQRDAADAAAPSWLEVLREALAGGAWMRGAGAAFAAAAVVLALRAALPPEQPRAQSWDPMASLWTLEEGDDDEGI